jgi:DNA sulfur modification protein DndC
MSSKLAEKIKTALKNIVDLYREDELPWIIGYSGGKDSTTVLQLVWRAVETIPLDYERKDEIKPRINTYPRHDNAWFVGVGV